jgi:hypothetical protein
MPEHAARLLGLHLTHDRRRLAYCVCAALALHAVALVSYVTGAERPVVVAILKAVEQPVPVAFEDEPAPEPAPAPEPPPPSIAPPPPPPAEPEAPEAAPAAPEPPKKRLVRAAPERPRVPEGKRPERRRKSNERAPEDATAFGGKTGAFRASVCLLPKNTRSALSLDGCKPVATFSTNEINVPPRRFKRGFPGVEDRVEWFGIDYSGRFEVRATGYYTFRLVSDDGAVLFIDGERVLDNDGIHVPVSGKMSMPLSAGEHDFRLLYFQGPGGRLALQLFVKGYGTEERPFGPTF